MSDDNNKAIESPPSETIETEGESLVHQDFAMFDNVNVMNTTNNDQGNDDNSKQKDPPLTSLQEVIEKCDVLTARFNSLGEEWEPARDALAIIPACIRLVATSALASQKFENRVSLASQEGEGSITIGQRGNEPQTSPLDVRLFARLLSTVAVAVDRKSVV